jgi:hypothetical protein
MPMSAGQDGRVRSPLSLQEQLEHLHFHETLARCKSACCSPLRPRETPQAEPQQPSRPALNRSPSSHHTDESSKSTYSTGTDGSSREQFEDSNLPPYLTKYVDANTFEQVR